MSFTFLFNKHIMFRKSCGKCHFTNLHRPSDKGCSLVLLNTEKGRKLFDAIRESLHVIPANLEDCMQPNLRHPSVIHPRRDKFEKEYAQKGFEYVYYKYGEDGWRHKLAVKIKNVIKKLIGRK